MIIILKTIGILLIACLTIFGARWLADNFNAWYYERQHREYLKLREECRREKEKNG